MLVVLLVVALVIIGVILLVAEVFVIPGFGIIGVLGIGALAGAAYTAYTALDPAQSAVAISAGLAAAAALAYMLPRKAGKSMVLTARSAGKAANPKLGELLGRNGVASTPLRPSGIVEIDGRPVDVITEGRYVDRDTRVEVIRVQGAKVVVKPVN